MFNHWVLSCCAIVKGDQFVGLVKLATLARLRWSSQVCCQPQEVAEHAACCDCCSCAWPPHNQRLRAAVTRCGEGYDIVTALQLSERMAGWVPACAQVTTTGVSSNGSCTAHTTSHPRARHTAQWKLCVQGLTGRIVHARMHQAP